MVKPSGNKAADLFQSYPTGFSVFAVGKAGAASLITLQKLAGVGSDLRWFEKTRRLHEGVRKAKRIRAAAQHPMIGEISRDKSTSSAWSQ